MYLVVGNRLATDPPKVRVFHFMTPNILDGGNVEFEPEPPKTPTGHPELEDEPKRDLDPPTDPPKKPTSEPRRTTDDPGTNS